MAWIRRAIIGLLGLFLVIDAPSGSHFSLVQFIVGIVMMGLVPIDWIIDLVSKPSQDEHAIDRLREVMKEQPHDDEGDPGSHDPPPLPPAG